MGDPLATPLFGHPQLAEIQRLQHGGDQGALGLAGGAAEAVAALRAAARSASFRRMPMRTAKKQCLNSALALRNRAVSSLARCAISLAASPSS